MLLVFLLLAYFFYYRNKSLQNILDSDDKARSWLALKGHNESLIKKVVRFFLKSQISLSQNRLSGKDKNNTLSDENAYLLDKRINYLHCELLRLDEHPREDAYWSKLFNRLISLFALPEPTAADDNEQTQEIVEEGQQEPPALTQVVNPQEKTRYEFQVDTGAMVQNKNLKGIVDRQYEVIRHLEDQIHKLDKLEPQDVEQLRQQLQSLQEHQQQAELCMRTLEAENENLREKFKQRLGLDDEADNLDVETMSAAHIKLLEESLNTERKLQELQQLNEQQNERIEQLQRQLAEGDDASPNTEITAEQGLVSQEQLQAKDDLINNLTRTNMEQMQCIAILEDEAELLKKQLLEQHQELEQYRSRPLGDEGADQGVG